MNLHLLWNPHQGKKYGQGLCALSISCDIVALLTKIMVKNFLQIFQSAGFLWPCLIFVWLLGAFSCLEICGKQHFLLPAISTLLSVTLV
ncbi:hypothetical protein L596_022604 [Steinernema carpocapsae]|uniref:Uncharacterized protein n=1 Tax=Steinernema carpocapsae TaxID=34508 RepID=A0A4U5MM50_STECR|nr:hypothetical protein L596_022604 [Steinernema carpocapsae]